MANLEAQAFSTRLAEQLKAGGQPFSATYIARQIHVTPHAARMWLMGVNIPKEPNMQWLEIDPSWLRFGLTNVDRIAHWKLKALAKDIDFNAIKKN